jgi:hypothetical protein
MKKILFVLVALLFATPAWADVDIAIEADGACGAVISFDARSEPNLPRAFSLDIQADNDANIIAVTLLSADYVIHPGTIAINTSGVVTDYGSPVAPESDLPSDTKPGLDSNGVTIEMGSLYAPVGPGSPNAPDPCGPLVLVEVDKNCTLTVTANVSRAGSSGVVMESPDEAVTVNLPAPTPVVCADLTCWTITECGGQPNGDATCDGGVNFADLIALKLSWLKNKGQAGYNCCADFDQSGGVNFADLIRLKLGWLSTGHTPATGNQNCPP